ncbi:hypothetical protein [Mesorhizobium sp. CO1-1-8]|uniref:hypothetical protein n=1 Tax=Mesorhizobium sp. CO1-1-8 TaxID=2876631 RepID=UPI001CD0691D|nr:hypothetical protein [Mesorhizobium sp. CO1-1-8]MBZ9772343.1 hypothetical protein [Mesorhizobium sp. CO1-1-8]
MTAKQQLSLDEFVTAAKKKASAAVIGTSAADTGMRLPGEPALETKAIAQEARKALRRAKRERLKGESFFVNVSLDRRTKRRLKLASFNAETSMQSIMEMAIVKYLDDIDA